MEHLFDNLYGAGAERLSLAKGLPFHQTDARETESQIEAMMRRLEHGADG